MSAHGDDPDLAGDVRHLVATLIRASLLADDEQVAQRMRDLAATG